MKRNYPMIIVLALVALLALPACGPAFLASQPAATTALTAEVPVTKAPSVSAVTTTGAISELETNLESIYAKVNPSVVSIQVVQQQQQVETPQQMPNFPPGFPFFFEPPQFPQQQAPGNLFRRGAGSGFVWDTDGHIITNNHVIDGASKIQVTFSDGTTVAGKVIGADPNSDLAVVKVDVPAEQLQPVQLGDSTQVKVGQLAVAIGNPFTLENTMTVGFVSAIGRQLPVSSGDAQLAIPGPTYTIPDIIQTDAPINPGNSGGVLVNDQGQVIGVTAAIESPVRASAGIGFAIPAAIVQKAVPSLIKTGTYEHPWLGLSGLSLNPDLTKAMNLQSGQRGVLVIGVTPGSPADKAGLHGSDRQVEIDGEQVPVGGDVITAIDGQPVKSFDDVVAYLAHSAEVNQTVKLTVLRNGKEETLNVTLAARPTSPLVQDQTQGPVSTSQAWLGIEGASLTPEIAQALKLPQGQQGVLIEQVDVNSPADAAGLHGSYKPTIVAGQRLVLGGDIITAIDGQPVTSTEDLQAFLQQAQPGHKVKLTLWRDGKQVEVSVTLGEQPANSSN